MAEFAINSSVNATTGYAPFKLNYGYMPRSGQHISTNTTFKGVKQFTQQVLWNLIDVHDAILEHRVMQTHYSNKHRRPGVIYHENDMVYLSTKNLASPKGWARKLMPRFLGPYKVLEAMNDTSNVMLELPPELKERRISPTFHTNLVRPHFLHPYIHVACSSCPLGCITHSTEVRHLPYLLLACSLYCSSIFRYFE